MREGLENFAPGRGTFVKKQKYPKVLRGRVRENYDFALLRLDFHAPFPGPQENERLGVTLCKFVGAERLTN